MHPILLRGPTLSSERSVVRRSYLSRAAGEVAWRRRGFAKANVIAADGHLLILDENGVLYLAEASSEELVVLDSAQLLDRNAWTVPTLVGTTLYARDRYRIVAVDLG